MCHLNRMTTKTYRFNIYYFGTIFAHFIQKREQIMGYTLKKTKNRTYITISMSFIHWLIAGGSMYVWVAQNLRMLWFNC